uniref:Uncharacterized protein n=1 Tax=Streptomyces sp. NBC_00049 TaxID=2903617 RepID=A0AAU2JWN5_9ACTN
MTHPLRTRRAALLAASAAMAAGAVLVPTNALAATPATAHTAVTDNGDRDPRALADPGDPGDPGDSGDRSTLLFLGPVDNAVVVIPYKSKPGTDRLLTWAFWKWGQDGPGSVRPGSTAQGAGVTGHATA